MDLIKALISFCSSLVYHLLILKVLSPDIPYFLLKLFIRFWYSLTELEVTLLRPNIVRRLFALLISCLKVFEERYFFFCTFLIGLLGFFASAIVTPPYLSSNTSDINISNMMINNNIKLIIFTT